MHQLSKIYVAGHNGLVGSAIVRKLKSLGYRNLITRDRFELNLEDPFSVRNFFEEENPEYVFLAAAKVGGIFANSNEPADFILKNLKIQNNVIEHSHIFGVKKLIFLGSSCIYPKHSKQPITESELLTGPLEETNLPYAIAKISGKVLCDSLRKQFGFNALTAMPSNVYGPGDNFHPENSHVVAGMMRRFHLAKENEEHEVAVWGSGKPLRELIYVQDLADAIVFLMNNYNEGGMVNVGSSEEITIEELAKKIAHVVGYKGKLTFDSTKPDGTPRKIMDNRILASLGWRAKTQLDTGLKEMYSWYLNEYKEK